MEYIPLAQCKDHYTYIIRSRNLIVGVFRESTGGFMGIREKFGSEYLFEEFHYDTGAPFGTVRPVRVLEQCPIADVNATLGTVCGPGADETGGCGRVLEFIRDNPSDVRGVWRHVDDKSVRCEHAYACSVPNDALFEYLKPLTDTELQVREQEWQER